MGTSYTIVVKTLKGKILYFRRVKAYSLEEGFIKFFDEVTKQQKVFHGSQCEIYEEGVSKVDTD